MRLSHFIILVVTVCAVIAQGFVGDVHACEMKHSDVHTIEMTQSHETQMSAHDSHHNHAEMTGMQHDASSNMDCCGEECACPTNACNSHSAFLTSAPFDIEVLRGHKVTEQIITPLSQTISGLYRPPIKA